MIAIVDYGVGNLFSLSSSLTFLGLKNTVTHDPKALTDADRVILPGVGAFGDAMAKLIATGLVPTLDRIAASGRPFLGICLGMQLLFQSSHEYGYHKGLGYLNGSVEPMADKLEGMSLKVPQMGWNALRIRQEHPMMKYSRDGQFVYFVHSFYATGCSDSLIADVEYGIDIPAVTGSGNVVGCQFHPEKSGAVGLDILRAFAEM